MPLEYAPRDTRDTLEADAYPTRTPEPERWIERVDPVVWQDWTEKAPISQAEAERFDRDGLKITGAIFNGLRLDRHRYGSGKYGYYSYQYR